MVLLFDTFSYILILLGLSFSFLLFFSELLSELYILGMGEQVRLWEGDEKWRKKKGN